MNLDQSWNESLIRSLFMPIDVEVILRIPIPNVPRSDQLVWHYDKRGLYTVKSSYHVALRLNYLESLSCSYSTLGWWKHL